MTGKTIRNSEPLRIVTAASLFDGHDASIHVMRRVMQLKGCEVIHLGHNRSAWEVVKTVLEEDADAVALTSYQGGHVEYFTYIVQMLKESGAREVAVFGGGGGVISPEEVKVLESRGVDKIFTPGDGQKMGLHGMIEHLIELTRKKNRKRDKFKFKKVNLDDRRQMGRDLSCLESLSAKEKKACLKKLQQMGCDNKPSVVGITGTGGAGKSSLIDELLLRFTRDVPNKNIAVLSIDPSKRKTGGALLGDRLRMGYASSEKVFLRSMATRKANVSVNQSAELILAYLKWVGYDLIVLETAGTGQSDSQVVDLSDVSVYVMTPDYGAPSQLEKIDMLDYADLVVLNKFDRQNSGDALRHVQKAVQRSRSLFEKALSSMPVFGTCTNIFNDPGINGFFQSLMDKLVQHDQVSWKSSSDSVAKSAPVSVPTVQKKSYLGDISNVIKEYHLNTKNIKKKIESLQSALSLLNDHGIDIDIFFQRNQVKKAEKKSSPLVKALLQEVELLKKGLPDEVFRQLMEHQEDRESFKRDEESFESLSHLELPRVILPDNLNWSQQFEYCRSENAPGSFPYTSGVFRYKREEESPTRMFAGEGLPERTNRRFHHLSAGQPAVRLSTAFDSVTLYGCNPHKQLDIYGKIGNAGVSVSCLDDAKRLYSGFDLCATNTSVSMTINGPAPIILAYFFNTAIDAHIERKLKKTGKWLPVEKKIRAWFKKRGVEAPVYREKLPVGHDESGLGFLGVSSSFFIDQKEYDKARHEVLQTIRGTVQADILKEDQAQNTCIFSTPFSLKLMGDIQDYFITNHIKRFYSVSISGYHIAEAGANPVTQLAFTLANAFTYVEYYLKRGMQIDDFAPNLSFFFSNGLDPEYAVLARVARRIWSIAMKEVYGANERSQKLKCHIQTSGRSLHAQEMDFNDIRTTLQAFYAINDHCNSLHTNAYDESLTTPTEESVRRAMAIQMIILKEFGLMKNQNAGQGSYLIEYLTKEVETAVLNEFEAIHERGGVLDAMEYQYQRGKIQEESLEYERKKHSGELPIVGVNTFVKNPEEGEALVRANLVRSTKKEKDAQVRQIKVLKACFKEERSVALGQLKKVAQSGNNIFTELMETVKVCTLGEITEALKECGGAYRRNM